MPSITRRWPGRIHPQFYFRNFCERRNRMDKIIGRAFMDAGGLITLKLEEEDGTQKEICFSCIRCGGSWPIDEYPGYYCVLGLLNGAKVGEPGSLLFLREGENELLGDQTEALIQMAGDLRLSEIFTDAQSPEWAGMSASALKMIRSH